ncbi:MAG: glycerate kinase [Lachnoclostridium sp.]|nr:glycerate kinase [Lachnoclostridium sp.]
MILVSPDKFKGTISARDAAHIIAEEFRLIVGDEVRELPLADGGEGTSDIIAGLLGMTPYTLPATDSLGGRIIARYHVTPDDSTVALDAGAVLSLTYLDRARLNIMQATSAPLGRLIRDIVHRHNPRQIYLGVGGTSTSDCGAGMLQALGATLRDENGKIITTDISPAMLPQIAAVDFSTILPLPELNLLCDVDVPLLAEDTAPSSLSFARQKGLSGSDCQLLISALSHWISLGVTDNGPFTGAGGGLISALTGRFTPRRGAEAIISLAGIDRLKPSLVVTGEGSVDSQSLMGKVTGTLAGMARRLGIPIIAIGGKAEHDKALKKAFDVIYSTVELFPEISDPEERLRLTAATAAHNFAQFLKNR